MQLAGLSLELPLLPSSREIDKEKQDHTPRTAASTSSGYSADPWQRQTSGPATFARQFTPSTPGSPADPWRRQVSSADPWQRQVSCESIGDFSGGGRSISLVPLNSTVPQKWEVTIDVAPEGQFRHMRRQLARSLKLPFGKILLVSDTETSEAGVGKLLQDEEPAAKATRIQIANLAKSPGLCNAMTKSLTREIALT